MPVWTAKRAASSARPQAQVTRSMNWGRSLLRWKSTWSAGFRVNCYREGRALQRCAGVTDADLASECDAVVAVTNCARTGRCDDTAAVTWEEEYIRGQSTHSRAALLAVGRCENRIRRHWLWGPFSPRILGLALPGRRWMILCKKHRPLAGKGSTDVTSSLGNRDRTDASRLGPGHIRHVTGTTENENVREALAGGAQVVFTSSTGASSCSLVAFPPCGQSGQGV